MARQKRKAHVIQSKNQRGHTYEESFDDNLLPDAKEIAELIELDPEIMSWLKERAEKEQDFRHGAFSERVIIVKKTEVGSRWINYLGLIFAFILMGGGMVISYFLIMNNHEVIGTIFVGGILLSMAALFLSKVKSNNNEKTPR